jgi:hypothetical protein
MSGNIEHPTSNAEHRSVLSFNFSFDVRRSVFDVSAQQKSPLRRAGFKMLSRTWQHQALVSAFLAGDSLAGSGVLAAGALAAVSGFSASVPDAASSASGAGAV